MSERTSSKRLFMIVAQMLKYADATTPVRFLIAECEAAFTPLTALYFAKLFGVADKVDIRRCSRPRRRWSSGGRVIDQLLDDPDYRAYVAGARPAVHPDRLFRRRPLSGPDAGLGSIERLRLRIAAADAAKQA